jgi:hypothetical protein
MIVVVRVMVTMVVRGMMMLAHAGSISVQEGQSK